MSQVTKLFLVTVYVMLFSIKQYKKTDFVFTIKIILFVFLIIITSFLVQLSGCLLDCDAEVLAPYRDCTVFERELCQ